MTACAISVKPPVDSCHRRLKLSNAFETTIVLEIARHAPAKIAAVGDHPKTREMMPPIVSVNATSNTAVSAAAGPMRAIVVSLSSSPTANISKITPSSESTATSSESPTSGTGTFGPITMPARM